ncbi:protein of unknown function [Acidithiobacillus ferrivorans]|uniref:Uncharacterized protein n=1 Tax=Acidithiobacillus ferrivorans TaxID=160808 RepID=A0A060UV03_9PROT|nr:hypothetical protein AFERRI_10260 [Acidithiobacillus ferrivorans]SMH65019.1 protein of unknown function [Acidithiobacillus ferrivorans]
MLHGSRLLGYITANLMNYGLDKSVNVHLLPNSYL